MLAIVVFALLTLSGLHAGKIVWDNDIDSFYPDYDFWQARDGESRAPNWFLIFPGTKWCGAGDIADNDDDLGVHRDTDKCCRSHDKCDDVILAHETKYNLTNTAFYSRLNCKCDNDFLQCLKSVDSRVSRQIGRIYFTALGTQCFKKEYPVSRCNKNTYFPHKKCVDYTFDESQEKIYQWFHVPNY